MKKPPLFSKLHFRHLPHPSQLPPLPWELQRVPPSQRTRQMEKDFANTQYKCLLEAEALEKKKKKELATEKEV
jgi:hypothetical protein